MVYHVEHGETDNDAKHLASGLSDPPLNERGKAQAKAAASKLQGRGITAIFHSPLKRASQTAQIISDHLGVKAVPRESLKPLDIGRLAGRPESTVKRYLEFFSKRPTLSLPDGEKFGEWYNGIKAEWMKHLETGKPIAVVSHSRDWQLLKHWEKNGLDADSSGINFSEPGSGQIAVAEKSGKSLSVRKI